MTIDVSSFPSRGKCDCDRQYYKEPAVARANKEARDIVNIADQNALGNGYTVDAILHTLGIELKPCMMLVF